MGNIGIALGGGKAFAVSVETIIAAAFLLFLVGRASKEKEPMF